MRRFFTRRGFTLPELLLAAAILVFVMCGILATYISCFELISTSKNLTLAINAAQRQIEEIYDYNFSQIHADYDNQTFTVDEISAGDSRGIIYVDDSNPDLLEVTISVCWRQRGNRIIGEDLDLDGVLDPGEDFLVANNRIDSPAQLVTLITPR
ncbi:MAG: prepilin-type N-terminal cleavage/methylation domain-containing protein [Candidatus Omnitrophica bacterium]|nr:prepilin-type N-terminal cleavage/methylation domain-containing protein [Candidatus Omnitrophota bacterium]MBU4472712.1 prepilin-type N-terminal cleavage/methylation domain-containing protein [Candidatus Omnitrophota bacterium]MCG2706403.1 prepilin-type N-terminal cleavage/methylation domain-containing protein [Candidatus Omnitrophota bacterium]